MDVRLPGVRSSAGSVRPHQELTSCVATAVDSALLMRREIMLASCAEAAQRVRVGLLWTAAPSDLRLHHASGIAGRLDFDDHAATRREALLRYPITALYADYCRAAFGLALTAGPLLLLDLAQVVAGLLAALGMLFAWFAMRTVLRHLSRVELSGNAIALCGPVARRLAWDDLERMRLAYYAPRRSRENGWMQLTLRGRGGGAIQLDSTLAGFDQVVRQASRAAMAKDLSLDAATHANLAALGLGAAGDPDPAAAPVSAPGPGRADAAPHGSRARW